MQRNRLADRIRTLTAECSPGELALAQYILTNTENVPFLSALELAEQAGLSTASVTRFSQRLGYKGYVDLQRDLRRELRETYSPSGPTHARGFSARYWQFETKNLEGAARTPHSQLEAIALLLAQADQVWVGGAQTMRPLAAYAKYFLSLFRPRVALLPEDVRTTPESLLDINEGDVALVLTVRRYAKATTRLGEALAERGALLILLTDDGAPPLARIAHHTINVPTNAASRMPSVTSVLAIVQLLVLLASAKCGDTRTTQAEQYFATYDAFEY